MDYLPTKEEVKLHFENTYTLRCLKGLFLMDIKDSYFDNLYYSSTRDGLYIKTDNDSFKIWENGKWAKIITYKCACSTGSTCTLNCKEAERKTMFPEIKNINTQPYYNGNNSLYYIAEDLKLNAWEFDILKRIARCRFKGSFKKDLQKTKDVIDIYLKEYESKL